MHSATKQTILASSTLTLALVSDAVLYLLLPIYFSDFLLTIIWVGVLLSANRFLRILLNPLIVYIYTLLGGRRATLLAVLFATVACAMFLFPLGPWVLLIARMLWGFAFGLLRLSCLYCATKDPTLSLKNMGWYAAIQELGPLLVLLAVPLINHYYSVQVIIAISLLLCLMAFIPALLLAQERVEEQSSSRAWLPKLNYQHFLTFVFCLLFDAVWVVVLAPLMISLGSSEQQALAIAAIVLVLKRGFNFLLGLVMVRYSQLQNASRWLNYSVLMMLLSAWLLASSALLSASLLAIVGHGLFMILMPKILTDQNNDLSVRKASLNDFTLWRDFAAALGALLAGVLLAAELVTYFYLFAAIMLSLIVAVYSRRERKISVAITE